MRLKLVETGQKLMAIANKTFNKLTNPELSIQVSLSGLSFCVLQKEKKAITFLEHVNFEKKLNPHDLIDKLQHLFNTESILQNNFSNVYVVHVNEVSTLVPKPFFSEDHLADYLKFNSKILKSDYIAFDDIEINDCINVYVPYINVNNFIYDKFGTFTFKHFSTILIEQILLVEKNAESTKFYVHVNSDHFEIIVVEKGKLILYNSFEYTTEEDFIYYILFTAEQLKLNPETLNLIFLGDIDKDDALYSITYKYIRHVNFGNRHDHYKHSQISFSNYSNFTLIKSF